MCYFSITAYNILQIHDTYFSRIILVEAEKYRSSLMNSFRKNVIDAENAPTAGLNQTGFKKDS